jgi:hypothetical protein
MTPEERAAWLEREFGPEAQEEMRRSRERAEQRRLGRALDRHTQALREAQGWVWVGSQQVPPHQVPTPKGGPPPKDRVPDIVATLRALRDPIGGTWPTQEDVAEALDLSPRRVSGIARSVGGWAAARKLAAEDQTSG